MDLKKLIKNSLSIVLAFLLVIRLDLQAQPAENQPSIHLNFNENPYGSFPSVKEAMAKALERTGFYPDEARDQFIAQLASYHSVEPNQILVSNGLSSLLFIIADAMIGKGSKIITADPTFDFFLLCATARGGQVIKVPLKGDYSHDLDAMLRAVDQDTKVVLITNPNNPTGTITSREEIDRFIEKLPASVYIIIDEAYHHFAEGVSGYTSYLEKPASNENVIVGRTFSKIYGMAGMRLGYVVSSAKTIKLLSNYIDPDNNNVAALAGASAALKDQKALTETLKQYTAVRSEFYKQLTLRKIPSIHSYANFVMIHIGKRDPKEVADFFKSQKILIGKSYEALPGYIRVSLGSPSQMEKFWEVWDQLP